MQPLRAHVRRGRLVVDEPTDLPEGEEVYVQLVEGVVPLKDDGMDDAQRAALDRELDASIAEADAGQTESFAGVIERLRRQL